MGKIKVQVTKKNIQQLSKKLPRKLGEIILEGHNEILNIPSLHNKLMKDTNQSYALLDLPLRNYMNVRLVSFIESFLTQQYADLIDNNGFKVNGKIEMDFSFLVDLRDSSKKTSALTNGEIVANQFNFQNFHTEKNSTNPETFSYFNNLTGKDMYAELVKKEGKSKVDRWIEEISTLIEQRHPIVHTQDSTLLTITQLKSFEASIIEFMFSLNNVVSKFKP
jgi:hypothetical protein